MEWGLACSCPNNRNRQTLFPILIADMAIISIDRQGHTRLRILRICVTLALDRSSRRASSALFLASPASSIVWSWLARALGSPLNTLGFGAGFGTDFRPFQGRVRMARD